MSFIIPFYQLPEKSCETTSNRSVKYRRETNEEKLNIVEGAQDVGIRKSAKLLHAIAVKTTKPTTYNQKFF